MPIQSREYFICFSVLVISLGMFFLHVAFGYFVRDIEGRLRNLTTKCHWPRISILFGWVNWFWTCSQWSCGSGPSIWCILGFDRSCYCQEISSFDAHISCCIVIPGHPWSCNQCKGTWAYCSQKRRFISTFFQRIAMLAHQTVQWPFLLIQWAHASVFC